ncbi:MAG: class I SAM-dependent methyltransferase, partial [Myxococcaceae bacterium]|nr:class I SAM-dependent methyltransferase [Myxococcaceae bacterium]
PVDFVGLDGQSLELPDASVDNALITFSLCTIPDASRALCEVRRVLRPGGRLHFLEHGLAPDAQVQRWQHRLEPLQRRLAGGCHLTRAVDRLVETAGFRFERLERFYGDMGPRPMAALYLGVAVAASQQMALPQAR